MINITCDRCGDKAVRRVEMCVYDLEASMSDLDLSRMDYVSPKMFMDLCNPCALDIECKFIGWSKRES